MADASERLERYPQFLRIHRSIVINADYLREVKSSGTGDCVVVLNDLQEFPVSRKHVLDEWMSLTRTVSSSADLGGKDNEPCADQGLSRHGSVETRPPFEHFGLI